MIAVVTSFPVVRGVSLCLSLCVLVSEMRWPLVAGAVALGSLVPCLVWEREMLSGVWLSN